MAAFLYWLYSNEQVYIFIDTYVLRIRFFVGDYRGEECPIARYLPL